MGAGPSKDEQLYQAVQNSNHQYVKSLRREGVSLEYVDKEGRTPLLLACTRGDLYDMVITLINEGANLNAYRAGPHGGYPLHHAAKRGLDKTVILLLSRGADPLALNDDGLTPLDMARNKSHLNVVRSIEEKICLFKGTLRELSGPGFLEYVPALLNKMMKKIWVVVLPATPQRNELVIYQNSKIAIPRTVISLTRAEIEEPKFHHHDPILTITASDKNGKTKFKFLSDNDGDKAQLERLYKACALGMHQSQSGAQDSPGTTPAQGLQALMPERSGQSASSTTTTTTSSNQSNIVTQTNSIIPTQPPPSNGPPAKPIPEDIALELAINNSLISASAEGVPISPSARTSWESNKWRVPDVKQQLQEAVPEFGGWSDGESASYGGWGSGSIAGPSRLDPASSTDTPSSSESKSGVGSHKRTPSPSSAKQQPPYVAQPTTVPSTSSGPSPSSSSSQLFASLSSLTPSAPPLPLDGPIHYPSIDMSPVQIDYGSSAATKADSSSQEKPRKQQQEKENENATTGGGQCVVCWDAPAEAVCIPCGHLSGCMNCLSEIKAKDWGCPVCRTPIEQVLKVYAV